MEQKIPKLLHYCWLSGEEKPDFIKECMETWTQVMPDYEIMCWDMERAPLSRSSYLRELCEAKKWQTASDYIRLYALEKYGGIYMDTDIKVYKPFDPFLHHSAFTCTQVNPAIFERQIREGDPEAVGIEAAFMAAIPHHPWIVDLLKHYDTFHFENTESFMRKIVMTFVVADFSAKHYGFRYEPTYQVLKNDVHVYPPDVFSLPADEQCTIKYATHWCANSWQNWGEKKYTTAEKIKSFIVHKLIGEKRWKKLKKR
jgi:hypothetical protein